MVVEELPFPFRLSSPSPSTIRSFSSGRFHHDAKKTLNNANSSHDANNANDAHDDVDLPLVHSHSSSRQSRPTTPPHFSGLRSGHGLWRRERNGDTCGKKEAQELSCPIKFCIWKRRTADRELFTSAFSHFCRHVKLYSCPAVFGSVLTLRFCFLFPSLVDRDCCPPCLIAPYPLARTHVQRPVLQNEL